MERKEIIFRTVQIIVLLMLMWVMLLNRAAIEKQRDDYLFDKTQSWVELCVNICPLVENYSTTNNIQMDVLINYTDGIKDLREIIFKTGGGICLPAGRERGLC